MRKIATAIFSAFCTAASAQIDRAGNVLAESASSGLNWLSVPLVIGFFGAIFGALYYLTSRHGEDSGAIYFFGGVLALLFVASIF